MKEMGQTLHRPADIPSQATTRHFAYPRASAATIGCKALM